ncbi:MAG TPA: hypothetical protein PL112_03945, partial [Candidatus Obscuribacter sp.]|nr:hypothetical protein [Candidatus Obscuribacter sp.]
RLRKWVGHLGDNHPPVEDRVTLLDGLAGSVCPRMHDIRADEAKRRRERIREERQRLNSKSAPPAVPPAVPPTASEEGQEGTADEGSETKPGQDPK